jgi:hypothetical protein
MVGVERRIERVIAAACALATGCALSIGGPQEVRARRVAPVCDTGKGPVMADGIGAVIGGLVAIGGGVADEGAVAAVGAIAAVIYSITAFSGNTRADACREAFVAYAKETDEDTEIDRTASSAGPRLDAPPPSRARRGDHGATGRRDDATPPAEPATTLEVAPVPSLPPPVVTATPPQPAHVPPPAPPSATKPATQDESPWAEFWREVGP